MYGGGGGLEVEEDAAVPHAERLVGALEDRLLGGPSDLISPTPEGPHGEPGPQGPHGETPARAVRFDNCVSV